MEPTWLWWSTGKDSAWTLHVLAEQGRFRVDRLITTVTPTFGRVAVHGTRLEVLEAQAESVGVPLRTIELPYPCTNEDYEAAVQPVIAEAVDQGVDHMAFGDLFLEDVRAYREAMLDGSGIQPVFPIWGEDTNTLASRMLDSGVEAVITSLDPKRVEPKHAGARFNQTFLDGLPETVDPCGENGEFHTCVVSGPMMAKPLQVDLGEVVEREGFVYADVLLR